MAAATYLNILKPFLATWEGFRATPYWDHKQWSWGYGTRVPGSVNDPGINPGGSITRDQAFAAMQQHFQTDYLYLKGLIRANLRANQWAALLSFSYQLGPGNADNLVPNINSGNSDALGDQWLLYNKVDGIYNQDSADRRQAEWELWNS